MRSIPREKANDNDLMSLAYLLKSTFHRRRGVTDSLVSQKAIMNVPGILEGMQEVLGNLAWILIGRSDFNEAMGLLKEKERICRETGNLSGLQNSITLSG